MAREYVNVCTQKSLMSPSTPKELARSYILYELQRRRLMCSLTSMQKLVSLRCPETASVTKTSPGDDSQASFRRVMTTCVATESRGSPRYCDDIKRVIFPRSIRHREHWCHFQGDAEHLTPWPRPYPAQKCTQRLNAKGLLKVRGGHVANAHVKVMLCTPNIMSRKRYKILTCYCKPLTNISYILATRPLYFVTLLKILQYIRWVHLTLSIVTSFAIYTVSQKTSHLWFAITLT